MDSIFFRETFSVFYRVTDATLANLPQTKLFNPVYYEKIDTVAAEVCKYTIT